MKKKVLIMDQEPIIAKNDDGFWFFIPSDDCIKYWTAEVELTRDINNELLIDDIQLFEVGANYES